MVKFTNQQRLEIIKNYYRNSESVVATLRALTPMRAMVDKFKTKFTLLDVPVPKRRRIARSEEIIPAVSASIQNEPNQSIPRRSQELGIAQDYLWPELDELDINDMWFQQDGATSHRTRLTIDLLKGKFSERVISRNGPVEWPPRSCDLTPLDFFLWGHIKSLVYANKPATLDDLKDNIQREIAIFPVEMCARVVENWVRRIYRCKRARGGHMANIEFHS